MSDFQHKPNRGTLWINDRKEKDSHPDRKGDALIDGVQYWVSGWLDKTKDGKPYLSLSFQPKEEQPVKAREPGSDDDIDEEFNDDIPF